MSDTLDITKVNVSNPVTFSEGDAVLMLQSSSVKSFPLHVFLGALFLTPGKRIYKVTQGASYTRAQWIEYSTTETYWLKHGSIGDLSIFSGRTSDTNQKFTYFFMPERDHPNGTHHYGHAFLLLLEGEPPLWGNMPS